MAFSDWQFDSISVPNAGAGTAYLHSALGSPLTGFGTYCRRFNPSAGGGCYSIAYIKDTSFGGDFFAVPNTRALRVEACLRMQVTNNTYNPRLLLGLKAANSNTGYWLGLHCPSAGSLGVYLRYNNQDSNSSGNLLAAAVSNTWYRLRMDVFPIGGAGDVIRVYQETVIGSGIWSTLLDTTIASGDARYAPWGGSGRQYFYYNTASVSTADNPAYIDAIYHAVKVV